MIAPATRRAFAAALVALLALAACGPDGDAEADIERPGMSREDEDADVLENGEPPDVTDDEDLASDEPSEEYGEYDDVYRNPGRYRRQRVNVSGLVVEEIDEHMMRINTKRGIEGGLLVLYGRPDEPLEVGDHVRVDGTMLDLEVAERRRDRDGGDDRAMVPGGEEYVIAAHEVTKLPELPY